MTRISLICFVALGSMSCSGGNICDEAAELCGQSTNSAGSCSGSVKEYASCIVDEGSCSATALAQCTGSSVSPPGSDAGFIPPSNDSKPGNNNTITGIELRAHTHLRKPDTEIVWVPITMLNHDEVEPLSTEAALFSVETDRATVIMPTADGALTKRPCNDEIKIAPGGKRSCQLIVKLSTALRPVRVRYRDPLGRSAQADLPSEACSWIASENTAAACSDGCDNDGNSFFDCGDFGCCSHRTGCPENTVCGQKEAQFCATKGPETTVAACSDGCDNDHDGFSDCKDRTCCAARLDCPAGTYCGDKSY